ncbi:MAG: hypothetical protein ACREVR_07230 [Burkholderiales bacterium]
MQFRTSEQDAVELLLDFVGKFDDGAELFGLQNHKFGVRRV